MKYTGKIKEITKFTLQADNQTYLDVAVEIYNEAGEVVETRKLGFPLDAGSEQIEAEVTKFIATYNADSVLAEQSKKVDAAHKTADEAIASLTGKEIL